MSDDDTKARLDRLQELSRALPFTRGTFTADDVRVRAGSARPRRLDWRWVAAAAVLLAVSHGGAFLLGTRRPAAPASPIAQTERFLQEAARLDAGDPPDRLRSRLVDLRSDLAGRRLPERLLAVEEGSQRRRAAELADALSQLEIAFDQVEDPGFLSLVVARIARQSLDGAPTTRFVPASAQRYCRLTPLGGGRYRVLLVDTADGLQTDEGTLPELRLRHHEIEFVPGE